MDNDLIAQCRSSGWYLAEPCATALEAAQAELAEARAEVARLTDADNESLWRFWNAKALRYVGELTEARAETDQWITRANVHRTLREEAEAERDRLAAQLKEAVEGLRSIAANTCCDGCQEAALVACDVLAKLEGKG